VVACRAVTWGPAQVCARERENLVVQVRDMQIKGGTGSYRVGRLGLHSARFLPPPKFPGLPVQGMRLPMQRRLAPTPKPRPVLPFRSRLGPLQLVV